MLKFESFLPQRVVDTPCVFTFGTFDGVHRGHQQLFQKVLDKARAEKMLAAVLTFKNHPLSVVAPEKMPLQLTTSAEKCALIEAAGFDIVIELEFTKELAALSADEFLERITVMLPIAYFLVGDDVVYGKNRDGNKAHLLQKSREFGFTPLFLSKFTALDQPISSTRIRQLLQEGKEMDASLLLGRQIKNRYT